MAGLISPATIEQIRAASDIVDVIGTYIPLKRAGANFRALCPFHKEKTPSFNVNPAQQIFKCFGCGKGGNVFSFVMEYESIGFVDAVRRLAERAKIPLEFDNNPGQQQARHLKDTLLQIHEQITQRWQNALANDANGQIARDYLMKRGVSEEAIKLFRLGYAPEAWDDTVNFAKSKGYEPGIVEQAGLILRKEGGGYYDRFRGRLMFPICDEQGRVIGFSGRILSGDEKIAKYVNSPETPIFTKGKVFFGLDKSKRALLDAHTAIICEGQLDLIACFMADVKNVVAPQGTALTADHARILKRYVEKIVFCFDSDNAGQNAAIRSFDSFLASGQTLLVKNERAGSTSGLAALNTLLTSGLAIAVATIPSPHDPDSFIKEFGGLAFQKLVNEAPGFFDYLLERLCKTHDISTDEGRRAIVEGMAESVLKTGSEVLFDVHAQKTALKLGVSKESVRNEFKKFGSTTSRRTSAADEENISFEEQVDSSPPPQEFWLLKLILQSDDHVEWASQHLDFNWISHSTVREILSGRFAALGDETWSGVAGWLTQIESQNVRNLITEALAEEPVADAETVLKGGPRKIGVVQLLRDKSIDRQMAEIKQRLSQPDLSEKEARELTQQQIRLRQFKQQPLSPLADSF